MGMWQVLNVQDHLFGCKTKREEEGLDSALSAAEVQLDKTEKTEAGNTMKIDASSQYF